MTIFLVGFMGCGKSTLRKKNLPLTLNIILLISILTLKKMRIELLKKFLLTMEKTILES